MNTTFAPHGGSSNSILTDDLDYTADLDAPPLASHAAAATGPSARIEHDVPFRDEVPEAPRAQRFPIAPGRVLSDRFVLTKLIGTGGMCAVYIARDLEAELNPERPRFVAVKTPRPDVKDSARAIERLQREFETARQLSHAGIVQVFELGCDGDVWYMTMELLEGQSLAAILRSHAGPLPPYLQRRVLRGIADSLAYAHASGVVHGDLNPANIFVLSGERVKLLDFGASRREDQPAMNAAAVAYASPQVLERDPPQRRDDVFSFGCIAYQVLSGSHPFGQRAATVARAEERIPQMPESLSNEQASALFTALAFERDLRPDDVRTLAATLAPDAPRQRIAYTLDDDIPAPQPSADWRWWTFGALCLAAMIAATFATRMM